MSIIVTNEITVPAERADSVAQKFAQNSQGLENFDGFEGFDLCEPTDPADERWLVITHWRDEAAYQAWRDSKKFAHSHASQSGKAPSETQTARPDTAKRVPAHSVVRHYNVAFHCAGD